MEKFSRRSFMKMAGLVAAAVVVPGVGVSMDKVRKLEAFCCACPKLLKENATIFSYNGAMRG